MRLAAEEADIVIATGGLGPTDDDLTREGFAEFLGVELELREDLLVRISEMFQRRGVPMVRKNAGQARIPKGADVVPNEWGTAPGIVAEKDGKVFFALPGVPREMEQMLAASVLPRLRALAPSQVVVVRRLRCFGAGESTIAEMIGDAMLRDHNPLVNCTAQMGVITLEIVATTQTVAEPRIGPVARRPGCGPAGAGSMAWARRPWPRLSVGSCSGRARRWRWPRVHGRASRKLITGLFRGQPVLHARGGDVQQ